MAYEIETSGRDRLAQYSLIAMQITCTDSTGKEHKQLVKSGNDDLRQDSVMQQFFGLVNHVLNASEATRKRQLHIRTYKVALLTPKQPGTSHSMKGHKFGWQA